ncbi:MAG: NADPH:quinone reductase-like Zn-dependent oxidoreductase, partial [Crocinitomicaceae bacterium]
MENIMKAVIVNSDSSMSWADTEQPHVAAGDVLIRVRATAINRA